MTSQHSTSSVFTARVVQALSHPRCAAVLAAALFTIVLLAPDVADARVGGGQSYSGGSSGRRSSGGSGGGGGGGDGIGLLIWLVFEHPMIGIPLLIVVAGVVMYNKHNESAWSVGAGTTSLSAVQTKRPSRSPRQRLAEVDPGFSEPLLIDFFQRLYATSRTLVPKGALDSLQPWFSGSGLDSLQRGRRVSAVHEVIFGATALTDVDVGSERTRVRISCEVNLVVDTVDGDRKQLLRHETWTLGRTTGVRSPGPDKMRALACPSCGDPSEPTTSGHCQSCGTIRTGGATHWEVEDVRVSVDRHLPPAEVHLGGGVEPGTHRPTRFDPDLAQEQRALVNRHPDFSWEDFHNTVEHTFLALQAAWSERDLERVRGLQSDALYQVHRFWMERYKEGGLENRMADVAVLDSTVAKVTRDAWFESITVRIKARMRDWTVEIRSGRTVGGSETEPRVFTEYWTFVRTIEAAHKGVDHAPGECPSCGAPLDQVSQAGVCGYCGSKITGGDFDWVLSRIEQDEAYAG